MPSSDGKMVWTAGPPVRRHQGLAAQSGKKVAVSPKPVACLFVEAVLYHYRAGIQWRDLPKRFGDARMIQTRHSRCCKSRGWQRMFETLATDVDYKPATAGSTMVRAH